MLAYAILAMPLLAVTTDDGSRVVSKPKLRTDLTSVFSRDSYPEDAWDAGEEGAVTVALTVNATGAVSICIVLSSSRSASLDSATCRIAAQKLVFEPARDEVGRAVEASFIMRANWEIPPTPMTPSIDRVAIKLDQGHTVSCVNPDAPSVPVEDCGGYAPANILEQVFGKAFSDIRRLEVQTIYQPGTDILRRAPASGRRATLTEVAFALNANGSVVGCQPRAGLPEQNREICADREFKNRRYSGASDFVFAMDLIADLPSNPK